MTVEEIPQHSLGEILLITEMERPNDVYIHAGRSYTFADVARAARAVAVDLRAMGVQPGDHVGILSLNSINWIIAFYAIQFVGGVSALMNPGLTIDNVVETIRRDDLKAICVGEAAAAREALALKNVYPILSTIDLAARPEPEAFEVALRQPSDPALILFSSGSTGTAKSVVHSSYSFGHLSVNVVDRIIPGSGDRILGFLPFFHIFGSCIFLGVVYATGGTIYLPKSIRTDDVLNTLDTYKCTAMPCVPQLLLAIIYNATFTMERVKSLLFCLVGGAPTTAEQWQLIRGHFPNTTFSDIYGLSECAPVSISMPTDDVAHLTVTVGKPCCEVDVKINAMSSYLPGEILIKAPNLMIGYYADSKITPACDEDGWFHTGDVGFIDRGGYLHISGRLKEIIIRGGENIMPNEVASVLSKHPAVADVKIVGIPHSFYGEVVGAALVLRKEVPFDATEFQAFCEAKLEKARRPAHVFCYDAFPMLPSGKVDMVTLKKMMAAQVRQAK